jgi:hypothetical protein
MMHQEISLATIRNGQNPNCSLQTPSTSPPLSSSMGATLTRTLTSRAPPTIVTMGHTFGKES